MAIRVERNEQGNCVNFHGSTNPTYWNACLTAYVDEDVADTINVVNDIITAQTGITEYEFYQIPYTEFTRADNSDFSSAQEAADYITAAARVVGVAPESTGNDLAGITVCFRLDDTHTSVILDNGYSFGVNTIKAVAEGGNIEIHSISGDRTLFSNLGASNVCINEIAVSGGLNDVVNTLNELFTVGAFESVVISDPYSTMVADVSGTATTGNIVGTQGVDPIGDDIFASTANGSLNGWLSVDTIDQAGEYFTFDIRNESQLGFGLVHTQASYDAGYYSGNSTYANPTNFGVLNSAHGGFQFSHWFHPTPNGSWTNYGANTSYSQGEAWYNPNVHFEARDEWLAGNPIKIRVGINENGFITISSLADDNVTWKLHARTTYAVAEGSEFRLGVKMGDTNARLYTTPNVHLLEPAAPTMYFRYIESPDGVFHYPLFATAEEADYYDLQNGGTGTSATKTYSDDPTGTTWYMPTNSSTEVGTSAPTTDTTLGQTATYTEVTSLTNADQVPPAFSSNNITEEEGTAINIPLMPADVTYSQSVTISPSGSGLVYNTQTGYLQGTLTDVGADTVYTITVTRANSYGSSTGSFTITATDVAPVNTQTTSFHKALDFSGGEYAKHVNNSMFYQPLQMAGLANLVPAHSTQGYTANNASSRPWATVVIFKSDGFAGNQMVWNQGEGSVSGDDNMFVNVTANGTVNFGWGRSGVGYNQCEILTNISSSNWYAVYIAHSGERLGGGDATAANLADCFDIRTMSSADSFAALSSNLSVAANWVVTGVRMDRTFAGDFTVGGRGTGYSFRGKIASMVVHCLEAGVPMQDATEIKLMITDPMKWETDYLIGNSYRRPFYASSSTNYQKETSLGFESTQIWLMGDGTPDTFPNINNEQRPNWLNYTYLVMTNMVSNDIETVNINGLT